MKWRQHNGNDDYHRLRIEADWSELSADYDDIVSGYAKVWLPGFRPGKVPRTVIEKRFQREIGEALSSRAVMRLGREALNEAGIDTLGPVEAEAIECERDKPIRFQVRFHPMPDIRLPEISSLKIDTGDTDPRGQISVRLLELVPFEVPGELVRDELALDGIHGEEPGSAEWEAAGDRIRLMLILKRIAKQEGIEVDEADLKCRIDEKTKEFGMTVKALEAELAKGGGMQRLSDMLLAESTLDYLLERNQNGVS